MAEANASARPQRQKLAYVACAIALTILFALLSKGFGLFAEDGTDKAVAPTAPPVFNEAKSKQYSQARMVSESEITPPPEIQLNGIVGGANGQQLAIISVNKAPESMVRVGDLIFAASTVTEINLDSLTYRHGSNLIRVEMKSRAPSSQGSAASNTENTQPGFAKSTGQIGQQSPSDAQNGNVEFRQAFEQKMKSFQSRP